MKLSASTKWMWTTVAFAIVVVTIALPDIVLHPWRLVPELTGDGGKNIYTYLYHILYEHGVWFRGMNYPYGEHIVYTDAQPLLSVPLSALGSVTVGEALAAMEWLIASGFVLSIVFNYKILTELGVKPFTAMLFAGLVGLGSPQVYRISGHYALAYSCIIPMVFFWTLRYRSTSHFRYAIYIFVLGVIVSFLHPYFSALIGLWVLLYAVGYQFFGDGTFRKRIAHPVPLVAAALAVFAVIAIFMKLTDPCTDRPKTPIGTFENRARLPDIVCSDYSPIWKFVEAHSSLHITWGTEGYCYPGLVAILVAIASLLIGLLSLLRSKQASNTTGSKFKLWLFISIAALLLSMGIPFIWHLEWLTEHFSAFRQFRTIGRFSWLFYYSITVFAAFSVYTWYQRLQGRGHTIAANALLVAALVIWGFETTGYSAVMRHRFKAAEDNIVVISPHADQNLVVNLREHHCDPEAFQALLIFKFFEIGSEKIGLGDDGITGLAIYTCLQMQRPMIDAMMSRTSWSVAEKQVRLVGGPYARKPILYDLKSDKPILILQRVTDSLDEDEKYLLTASDYIGDMQYCHAYALYPVRLRDSDKRNADFVRLIAASVTPGHDSCVVNTGAWFVQHFDSGKAQQHFFGSGAASYISSQESVIATIPLSPNDKPRRYEYSTWFLVSDQDYKIPDTRLDYMDSAGKTIGSDFLSGSRSKDNDGLWLRCGSYVTIPAGCSAIKCTLLDNGNSYIAMDEMMLRPAGSLIVSRSADGHIMANNHLLISH